MQVMRLEVMVLDMDGLGAESVIQALENQKYPNYCISPKVKAIDVREIGEWSDDHPLNHRDKADAEYKRLFETPFGSAHSTSGQGAAADGDIYPQPEALRASEQVVQPRRVERNVRHKRWRK